jgi:hypothetical protein
VLATLECRDRQQLGCGYDSLTASAVYPYLEDARTLNRGSTPEHGVFPYPAAWNYACFGGTGWFDTKMSSGSCSPFTSRSRR